jgi:hypothetical protein
VDTCDAITSNRVYDKGRASMQALDIIHNQGLIVTRKPQRPTEQP